MRTPDELRLSQIAEFFGVTVEFLRRDNNVKPQQEPALYTLDHQHHTYAGYEIQHMNPPALREPEAPPYGLPSLRREESLVPLNNISELSNISSRLLSMVCSTTKGVLDGKFDAGKSIVVLRRLSDILEQKLREAESQGGNLPPPSGY